MTMIKLTLCSPEKTNLPQDKGYTVSFDEEYDIYLNTKHIVCVAPVEVSRERSVDENNNHLDERTYDGDKFCMVSVEGYREPICVAGGVDYVLNLIPSPRCGGCK